MPVCSGSTHCVSVGRGQGNVNNNIQCASSRQITLPSECLSRPVVDVLAEAERGHFHAPLAVDQAIAGCQVFVDKAVIGEVLHPMSHLGADGNLNAEQRQNCQGKVTPGIQWQQT